MSPSHQKAKKPPKNWDGSERRDYDSLKDERAFRRSENKRKKDQEDTITFYVMLGILGLAIMVMVALPILHQMGAF